MDRKQKFWHLIEKAKSTGIFFHDNNTLFIREDLKENSVDKVIWIPAFWQALFGEHWRAVAHKALDARLSGGDIVEFVYEQYLNKGVEDANEEENDSPSTDSGQLLESAAGEPASAFWDIRDSVLPDDEEGK